jgi:hypothetical protein
MKNLLILLAFTIIFYGCSKDKGTEVPRNFKQTDLEKLNKYRPDEDNLASVYHSFVKEIKQSAANYKTGIDPVDRPLDETVWLLDVTTNTELGFKNDSIEELFIDTLRIVFNNKSFTPDGIPVIDGNEIVSVYTDFENSVNQNLSQGFLLWATQVEITGITADESEIEIITAGGSEGFGLIMPLPPGVDPPPFSPGTWFNMYNGAIDYRQQIKRPGYIKLAPGWIMEYYNNVHKSWYIGPGQYDNRIAHSTGNCFTGLLSGSSVNNYLYGEKEVIDENNPNGWNDFIVAYFFITCFDQSPTGGMNSWHFIDLNIYKLTYVGIPD